MIDVHHDTLLALCDVPKVLPKRNGRRLHISTVYRWALRGVRRIKLDTIKVGGTTYTSMEALQAFGVQLTDTHDNTVKLPARQRLTEKAARQVQRILYNSSQQLPEQ